MSSRSRFASMLAALLAVATPLGAQDVSMRCYDLFILSRTWSGTTANPAPLSDDEDDDPLRVLPERFRLTDQPVEEVVEGAPLRRWIVPVDSLGSGSNWPYANWGPRDDVLRPYAHWSAEQGGLTLGWGTAYGGYSARLDPDPTIPGAWRGSMSSWSDGLYLDGNAPGRWIYRIAIAPFTCDGVL